MQVATTQQNDSGTDLVIDLTKKLAGAGNVSANGETLTIISTPATEAAIQLLIDANIKNISEDSKVASFELSRLAQNSGNGIVASLAEAVSDKIEAVHKASLQQANERASNELHALAASIAEVIPTTSNQIARDAKVIMRTGSALA